MSGYAKVDTISRLLALRGGNIQDNSITEQKLSTGVKEILHKTPHQMFMDKFCPNIYPNATGTIGGVQMSVARTCEILANMGCKQVNLLLSIGTYSAPNFTLLSSINYATVISTIHSYDMTIPIVRVSNTAYGKDNMMDNTKLADLGTSLVSILSSLGISNEVETVMVLNETAQVTTDATYNTGVADCLNALKTAGYEAGVSDGAKVFINHTPENIALYDHVGFNDYPKMACLDTNQHMGTAVKAWESENLANTMGYLQSLNIKTSITEYGCTQYENTLANPEEFSNPTGEFDPDAMRKYVALYLGSFKTYAINSGLNDTCEYFCPWGTHQWFESEAMHKIYGEEL